MKIILMIVAAVVLVGGAYWYMSTASTKSVEVPEEEDQAEAKIDINAVCEGALAYMSFPDGEAAAQFVAECKEGQHPEVIERYKADMGLGDGAAI